MGPGRDTKAVVVAGSVFDGGACRGVDPCNDVSVQEAVTPLEAGLARGVQHEVDTPTGQIGVSGQRSGVVDHVDRERAELQ